MKRISIITINYNNRDGLQQTMDSVLQQTAAHEIEYIVIDGGSSDGSKELIQEYETQLNYWVSEKDNGVYDAMNKGIAKAKGEYLLFLNSGDYLYNHEVIAKSIAKIKNHQLYYGQLQVTDSLGRSGINTYHDSLSFAFFVTGTLPHPATFIHRDLFQTVGNYNDNMKICADWDFFIRAVCLHNASYQYLPFPISSWSLGGISTTPDAKQIIAYEKHQTYERYFKPFYKETLELLALRKRIFYIEHSYVYALSRLIEKCKLWFKREKK